MTALAGVSGDVWFSTSPPTALGSPETMNDSGDHIHYFTATHQAWDQTQTFTVQCSPNGSTGWVTVTDYTFFWPVGEIVFNSARVPGTNANVKILAGSYFTLTSVVGAHNWKQHTKVMTKDVTPFQATGKWQQNITISKSMTFSVDMFNQDARILNEMIKSGMSQINISGGIIVVQLWWDEANGKRTVFYGLPQQEDTTVASNDVDKQTVTMTSTGPVYYVTSNTFSTATVKQG